MDSTPLVVSRDSWHYRLLRIAYTENELPKTLCGYFWMVVLAPIAILGGFILYVVEHLAKGTVIPLLKRIISWGPIATAIIFSAVTSSVLTAWGLLDWKFLAIAAAFVGGVLIAMIVIRIVGIAIADHREKKVRPETTSTARLLLAAMKAKKRKICPLIEVR